MTESVFHLQVVVLGSAEDDEELEGELEDGLRCRLAGSDPYVHSRHPGRLAEQEGNLGWREEGFVVNEETPGGREDMNGGR